MNYLFIHIPYFLGFETTVVGFAVTATLPFHLFSSYFLFDPSFLLHFGEVKQNISCWKIIKKSCYCLGSDNLSKFLDVTVPFLGQELTPTSYAKIVILNPKWTFTEHISTLGPNRQTVRLLFSKKFIFSIHFCPYCHIWLCLTLISTLGIHCP